MALVELRRYYDRNEAYIAHAALENAGLGSMIRDNDYASMVFGAVKRPVPMINSAPLVL